MDSLNDDCQQHVLDYLGVKDHLSLWKACEDISPRLKNNIEYNWRRRSTIVLAKGVFATFEEHPNQADALLSAITQRVENLELQYVTPNQLQAFMGHEFPRVRSLSFSLDEQSGGLEEVAMNLLMDTFPSCMMIHQKMAESWRQMRRLDTTPVHNFQQLESLTIQSAYLRGYSFIDRVLQMPKMRKISFFAEEKSDKVMRRIIKLRGRHVCHLVFNDSIWYCMPDTLRGVQSLKGVTIIKNDGFRAFELEWIMSSFGEIEHLDLIGFTYLCTGIELWQLIAKTESLRTINISGMRMNPDSFKSTRKYMQKALRTRRDPLKLHCYNTGECKALLTRCFKHPKLQLDWEPRTHDHYTDVGRGYIKVEFIPLERTMIDC